MKKDLFTVHIQAGTQSDYAITLHMTTDQKKTMHDTVVAEYQKQVTKPWFRKWHVPLAMVEEMVGPGQIMMASIEEYMQQAVQKVVTDNPTIKFIGEPYGFAMDQYETADKDGKFTLSFRLDVYPEIVVQNNAWQKDSTAPYAVDVTDAEVDETLMTIRSSYAEYEAMETVDTDAMVRVKVSYTDAEGTAVATPKTRFLSWEDISSTPALTASMKQKKVGDSLSLSYGDVSALQWLAVAGDVTPTTIHLEILDIKKKTLPELDQAFIDKTFAPEDNIQSVDALKQKIRETIADNRGKTALLERVDAYVTRAMDSFAIIVPQTMIDEEMKNRIKHMSERMGGEKWLQAYLQKMGEAESKKYIDTIRDAGHKSIQKFFVMRKICEDLWLDINRSADMEEGAAEKMLYEKVVGKGEKGKKE